MREDARIGAPLDHVRSYYEALNSGDPDRVAGHFTDDAVHYYTRLGPHEGARTIGEHTKWAVENIEGRWKIEDALDDGERVVIEWTMTCAIHALASAGSTAAPSGSSSATAESARCAPTTTGTAGTPSGDLLGFDHAGRGHTMLEGGR